MVDYKAVIKGSDMPDDMMQDAIECGVQALQSDITDREIAAYVKKEFDKKYGPTWHCIVGKHYGSFVTHEAYNYMYFMLGQKSVLIFKSA